jgi:hypothetical protein
MNINKPDIASEVYKQFEEIINQKVNSAVAWLCGIKYIKDYIVDEHLYRLYIPCKDLLLDFEWFPVINPNFNYVRVDFLTDIENVLEKIFPETIIDTQQLDVWKLNQLPVNKFLRRNGHSPIYDDNVIRLALVGDNMTIYQCVILKDNKIIANVTEQSCSVPYGTLILLRQLNEVLGISDILIKENLNNSYHHNLYRILGLPVVSKSIKKKIWWSPEGTKWRIKKEHTDKYIPFYYCEDITYKY